jgi:hypothetical protein
MSERSNDSSQNTNRRPSFGEQMVVTFVIILATCGVFGSVWLLDVIAH